jgi:hypothetical protein
MIRTVTRAAIIDLGRMVPLLGMGRQTPIA